MTEITMHRTRISGQDWSALKHGPAPTVSAPYEAEETTFVPVGEVERLRAVVAAADAFMPLAQVAFLWQTSGARPGEVERYRDRYLALRSALSSEGV